MMALRAAMKPWAAASCSACRPWVTRRTPATHRLSRAELRWLPNTWAESMLCAGRARSARCCASSTTKSAALPPAGDACQARTDAVPGGLCAALHGLQAHRGGYFGLRGMGQHVALAARQALAVFEQQ